MMVISPDEGAMHRAIYTANHFGVDVGMFYKRRDYSRVVNGKNPIVAHEFLGDSVEGKDVIIVDDMIASGGSMLDTARQLKEIGARRVFIFSTFGLFTSGLSKFDQAFADGWFDRIFTTNLIYQTPELLSRKYYFSVRMDRYLAALIDTLNKSNTIQDLIKPENRIHQALALYQNK
jgi:ribose-phosphate pyrophosphokinase